MAASDSDGHGLRRIRRRDGPWALRLGVMLLLAFATNLAEAAFQVAPTAVPASLVAGATGDVVATFTPGTTLTQDGKIVIEFPASFHAVAATSVTTSGLTGTVAVATSGKTITITRQVRGASKVEEQ